ncbi:hypothetical protein GQ457_18G009080 [Hibiscus cannabinus]
MAESLLSKLGELTFTAEEQDAVLVTPDAVAIPASNVLKRGPWDFQKYWFSLEQADPNRTIHDYSFQHMCIWVRIHNIPLSLMTTALARALGASIAFARCVVLSRPDAKASLCPLQYERLPLFCHGCGLIGHSVLACPTTPKLEGQKFQYDAWLRAPLPKRSASWPRGGLFVVGDDTDAPEMVDSTSEGPSIYPDTTRAAALASDLVVPVVVAPATRTPPAPRLMMPPWTRMPRKRLLIARLPMMLLMTQWSILKPLICWRKRLRSRGTASSCPT